MKANDVTATHAVQLPRIDINKFTDSMKEERLKMLGDAADTLGYRAMSPHSLLHSLFQIDVAPFKSKSVEEYKNSKARNGMYSGTRNWVIWLGLSVTVLVGGIWGCHRYVLPELTLLGILSVVATVAGGISAFICLIPGSEMRGTGNRTCWEWQVVPIKNYEEAIPDHILLKALQIKKAIPEAELLVSYLSSSREHRDPDPFLMVSLDNGEKGFYYVEQWDERDFPQIGE